MKSIHVEPAEVMVCVGGLGMECSPGSGPVGHVQEMTSFMVPSERERERELRRVPPYHGSVHWWPSSGTNHAHTLICRMSAKCDSQRRRFKHCCQAVSCRVKWDR